MYHNIQKRRVENNFKLKIHTSSTTTTSRLLLVCFDVFAENSLEVFCSNLLHFFWHFMRIQHARHSDLNFTLLVLSLFESDLSFLEEKIRVVRAGELPDLHEEVSQVLLEARDVLVQVEETRDCDFDLVVRQMREGCSEQIGDKFLDEGHVAACPRAWAGGVEADGDLVGLHQGEHVG